MSDDNTPIDASKPGHQDYYPTKSVNDMKALIAQNQKAMDASGERALTIPEYRAAINRGEHPLTAVDWWQLRYNNSSYHVFMHMKQDKLHEARTKN